MRSRAVSFPALCSRSRRSAPPPASASSEMRRNSSMRSPCLAWGIRPGFVSDNGSSLGRGFLWGKDAHREMRGEPDGSEKQHDAEEQLRAHGGGALEGRFERSHVLRGPNENEHSREGHHHDEDGGQNGRRRSVSRKAVNARLDDQRNPDQSSATRMESLGLAASYLMLAGWPATRRSRRTWLSSPVMSCAV